MAPAKHLFGFPFCPDKKFFPVFIKLGVVQTRCRLCAQVHVRHHGALLLNSQTARSCETGHSLRICMRQKRYAFSIQMQSRLVFLMQMMVSHGRHLPINRHNE